MTATMTAQERPESKNCAGLKSTFMPAIPARRAPGRRRIETIVRIFTISFVRCSVRTIRTSTELAIASLTSRAEGAGGVEPSGQLDKPLTRLFGREQIELGVAKSGRDLTVWSSERRRPPTRCRASVSSLIWGSRLRLGDCQARRRGPRDVPSSGEGRILHVCEWGAPITSARRECARRVLGALVLVAVAGLISSGRVRAATVWNGEARRGGTSRCCCLWWYSVCLRVSETR